MSSSQPIPTELPSSYPALPYKEIRISHHPESSKDVTPVLVCTLYRPEANNAFTDIMEDELEHFFGLASIDDRVKIIVLTGHGRMFCAGMDLNQGFVLRGNGKWETDVTHRDGGGRVSVAMHQCTKPTIVAINGHAIGVGITMTMPAVMRYVWTKAKIGFVFSRRGVVTEGCSSFFLPRLLGYAKALQLLISGATHQADSKHLDGLFTELVDKQEDVLPKALAQAEELARETSSVSTFMIREMMWRGGNSAEEAHLLESRVMGHMRGSKDNNEAVNAFLQKRKAEFVATMKDDAPPVWPWFTPVNTKNRPVASAASNGITKL